MIRRKIIVWKNQIAPDCSNSLNALIYIVVLILVSFDTIQVNARQKAKNSAGKIAPQAKLQKDTSSSYRVLLLPEFFHLPVKKNDTVFKYECKWHRELINIDTLHSIDNVDEISYTKNFYEFSGKNKGIISAPYLSKEIYDYERTDADMWVEISKKSTDQTDLKENKKIITRADTIVVANPITRNKQQVIYKYYKIIRLGEGHHKE